MVNPYGGHAPGSNKKCGSIHQKDAGAKYAKIPRQAQIITSASTLPTMIIVRELLAGAGADPIGMGAGPAGTCPAYGCGMGWYCGMGGA